MGNDTPVVENVTAHEIGHHFGLAIDHAYDPDKHHHTQIDPSYLMYSQEQGDQPGCKLLQDQWRQFNNWMPILEMK